MHDSEKMIQVKGVGGRERGCVVHVENLIQAPMNVSQVSELCTTPYTVYTTDECRNKSICWLL